MGAKASVKKSPFLFGKELHHGKNDGGRGYSGVAGYNWGRNRTDGRGGIRAARLHPH